MKRLLITVVLAATFFVTSGHASAAGSSHYKAAEDLLAMMDMENLMQKSISQMLQVQLQRQPQMEPYKDVMLEFFSKYLSWSSLKDEYIDIYVSEFDESELRDMIAFYKTSTGQKALNKMPLLMNRGAQIGSRKVQENAHILRQMITAKAQELQGQKEMQGQSQKKE